MKVIIAGSRGFHNYEELCNVCDPLLEKEIDIEIVSGTAGGADRLGERYAEERGYKLTKFPANWDKFSKSAGYKRNEDMAKYADALISFWDGKSRGTEHMNHLAHQYKLKIKVHIYDK